MRDQINERKKALKVEIETAEKLLSENMKSIQLGNYFIPSMGDLTERVESFVSKPEHGIASLDMVSRNLLPKSNLIRKLLKYLNLGMKLFSQFSQIRKSNVQA